MKHEVHTLKYHRLVVFPFWVNIEYMHGRLIIVILVYVIEGFHLDTRGAMHLQYMFID